MARRIYIGTGTARKVKTVYIGSGNAARKIVKGYVGVGNQAKQFWPLQHVWNRYSIKTTTKYSYTRTEILRNMNAIIGLTTNSYGARAFEFDDATGLFTISNRISIDNRDYGTWYGTAYTYNSNSNILSVFECDIGSFDTIYDLWNTYASNGDSLWQYRATESGTTQSQGDYIDQVKSENRSAYPDNGVSGTYWYVYQGEG